MPARIDCASRLKKDMSFKIILNATIGNDKTKLKINNIFLEITSRTGHGDTNAHVAERALKFGAKLILNTDSHEPQDFITHEELINVAKRAGLNLKEINKIYRDISDFLKKKEAR